jgi:pimeloyl-ACP methyl ester carboxylesterase
MPVSDEFHDHGNTLRYTRCGTGSPILFIHNGGASKEIWDAQVDALRVDHQVICLDLLGYGESDIPRTGYLITDYVDGLERFIDHLGLGPVLVVGNCMGSAMSLLLADRRPDLFRGLIAINPLSANTARNGVLGAIMWIPAKLPRLSVAACRIVRVPRSFSTMIITAQFGPRHWWRGVRAPSRASIASGATWTTRGRLAALAELFSDISGLRAVDHLVPGSAFPPLVTIWGASNLGLSPRAGTILNTTLRPHQSYSIRGAGHLPMIEAPSTITRIIREVATSVQVRQ